MPSSEIALSDKRESEIRFVKRFNGSFYAVLAFVLRKCLQQTHSATESIDTNDGNDECGNVANTLLLLIAFWHLVTLVEGIIQHTNMLSFYRFILPLSLCLVLPDWFLVSFAGTMEYSRNGASWMFGGDAVSLCMAGMWGMPTLFILETCYPVDDRLGKMVATAFKHKKNLDLTAVCYAKAAIMSLILFGASEQLLPFIWNATDRVVHRIGWGEGTALYVVLADILLGPTILYFYHVTKDGNWYEPVIGAVMTMLIYTGALSIALLALEGSPHTGNAM